MIGTTFFDTMDHNRYIRPLKDLGTHFECEVFWSENGRSFPAGRTKLNKRLFDPNHSVGFKVYVPVPQAQVDADLQDMHYDYDYADELDDGED